MAPEARIYRRGEDKASLNYGNRRYKINRRVKRILRNIRVK
jgi:hypothetical protein